MTTDRHVYTETGVEIERPVPEVFDFFVRFENVPRYVGGVIKSYQASEGPSGVGTMGVEVLGPPFEGTELMWRISRFEPNRLCAFQNTLPLPLGTSVDREVAYEFSAIQGGTRVRCTHAGRIRGPLRPIGLLLSALDRRARSSMLQRIKQLLEAEGETSSGHAPERPA